MNRHGQCCASDWNWGIFSISISGSDSTPIYCYCPTLLPSPDVVSQRLNTLITIIPVSLPAAVFVSLVVTDQFNHPLILQVLLTCPVFKINQDICPSVTMEVMTDLHRIVLPGQFVFRNNCVRNKTVLSECPEHPIHGLAVCNIFGSDQHLEIQITDFLHDPTCKLQLNFRSRLIENVKINT